MYGAESKTLQRKAESEPGSVLLLNGIQLSLSEKPNVDFGVARESAQPRSAIIKKLNVIQGYYDYVKHHIRNGQTGDNLIIKYQSSKCLNERQIDAIQQGMSLKKLNELRIAKYANAKK